MSDNHNKKKLYKPAPVRLRRRTSTQATLPNLSRYIDESARVLRGTANQEWRGKLRFEHSNRLFSLLVRLLQTHPNHDVNKFKWLRHLGEERFADIIATMQDNAPSQEHSDKQMETLIDYMEVMVLVASASAKPEISTELHSEYIWGTDLTEVTCRVTVVHRPLGRSRESLSAPDFLNPRRSRRSYVRETPTSYTCIRVLEFEATEAHPMDVAHNLEPMTTFLHTVYGMTRLGSNCIPTNVYSTLLHGAMADLRRESLYVLLVNCYYNDLEEFIDSIDEGYVTFLREAYGK